MNRCCRPPPRREQQPEERPRTRHHVDHRTGSGKAFIWGEEQRLLWCSDRRRHRIPLHVKRQPTPNTNRNPFRRPFETLSSHPPNSSTPRPTCQLPLCRKVILMLSLVLSSMPVREKPVRGYSPVVAFRQASSKIIGGGGFGGEGGDGEWENYGVSPAIY